MAKANNISTKTVIDFETGEVKSETKQYQVKSDEPSFIKLYCNDLGAIGGLSPMACKVLFALAMNADYKNEVRTTVYDRKLIAEHLNASVPEGSKKTSEDSIRYLITQLCDSGFLVKKATGLHILNPKFFTKNNWVTTRETQEDFELRVRYSRNGGRTVEVNFN